MGATPIPTQPVAPQMAPMPASWQQIARANLMAAPPVVRPGDLARYMGARARGLSHEGAMTLVHRAQAAQNDPIGTATRANLYGPGPDPEPTEAPWAPPQPKTPLRLSDYLKGSPMATPTAQGPSLAATPAEAQAVAAMGTAPTQTAAPSAGTVPTAAALAPSTGAAPAPPQRTAKPTLSGYLSRKPLGYAEWARQNPALLQPMALPQAPGLGTRLAQGVAAAAAGWGRPLAGVEALKAERAPAQQQTQMAAAYNAKLPQVDLAQQREGYNQYLEGQRVQASEQNAAADRALRQEMLALEEKRVAEEAARPGAQARGQWVTDLATGKPAWATPEQLQANPAAYGPYAKPSSAAQKYDPIAAQLGPQPTTAQWGGRDYGTPGAAQKAYAQAYTALKANSHPSEFPRIEPVNDAKGNVIGYDTFDGGRWYFQSVGAISGFPAGLHGVVPPRPTGTTLTMSQMAESVRPIARSLIQEIHAAAADLGPAAGRWNDYLVGKVGADNPRFAQLKTNLQLYASAVVRTHFGGRGGQEYIKQMEDAFRAAQSPQDLIARIEAADQWLSGYAAMTGHGERSPTASAAAAGTAPPEAALPPEAARALQDGHDTTFNNGQVWTLRNGKPFRVR